MKTITLAFLALLSLLMQPCIAQEHSICFIHIGNKLPGYLQDAVVQARRFNPTCPIYVLVNRVVQPTIQRLLAKHSISCISLETIPLTVEHKQFIKNHGQNRAHKGLWKLSKERFLYLYDLMAHKNLQHVFHLENDVMLYVDLNELLPYFKTTAAPIAATFDNDERVIAGFIYLRSALSMQKLAQFFTAHAAHPLWDMELIAAFKKQEPDLISHLPIIMKEYAQDNPLQSTSGLIPQKPSDYFEHATELQSIFDAAAIGQYLGGVDPMHNIRGTFINESCIFNSSRLSYSWQQDHLRRKVPYASYKGAHYRINNIHVHSKNLKAFAS